MITYWSAPNRTAEFRQYSTRGDAARGPPVVQTQRSLKRSRRVREHHTGTLISTPFESKGVPTRAHHSA